jgi:hypothetical protein
MQDSGYELPRISIPRTSVNKAKKRKGRDLELAPIGWQLFVLKSGKSDSIAFLLLLDTYATRLLAQALNNI